MRQRGVLGALSAAVFLGVVGAAVVLPAAVAAASVSPAPASTVSVRLVGEARVGALLTATVDFEHGVALRDLTSIEFEWLLEKPAVEALPTQTAAPAPAETAAARTPGPADLLAAPVPAPASLPLLTCVPSIAVTPDAVALPPSGPATPAPTALPTPAPLPQQATLAALPVLPLAAATQVAPAADSLTPTPTPTPTPESSPAAPPALTPTPAPTPPTTTPRGPEYTVLPADLGHTIRVRAAVSIDGQLVATCESAPTALVVASDAVRPGEAEEPLVPLQPATPTELVVPTEAMPSQWSSSVFEGSGEADGEGDELLAQPAPAASGPVVAISLSSEVMLIGGAAVLVVVAGLAIFGRNES